MSKLQDITLGTVKSSEVTNNEEIDLHRPRNAYGLEQKMLYRVKQMKCAAAKEGC